MNIKKMLKSNSMINSAVWYTIGSFFLKGVNFFTVPIFTELLSTAEMGRVTIYSTWGAIVAIIVGLGIEGTVGSAKANLKDDEYTEYLSSALILGTVSFIAIFILCFIFKGSLSNLMGLDIKLIILLLIQSFFSFVISFVLSTYTFARDHKMYLTVSCFSTILNIVLSIAIILSMDSNRYLGRILGWAISTILIGVVLYIKIIIKGKVFFSLKYWKFCLPIALPLIFHNLSHLLLNQADILMLENFTDESTVGIYGVLYMIGSILNIIQIAINGAWVPWYYEALKKGDKDELRKKSGAYIIIFTILTTMFMLGVPEVIKLFTDRAYWGGIPLTYIVIMGYYFVYLYTFPANFQFYSKQTKFIAMGTVTAAIVNVGFNYIFIQQFGMYGAAIATLIAYIILFSIHFIIVKYKFKHQDFPFAFNIYGVGVALCSWIISYLLLDYFIIRWIIIIIIFIVSAIIVLKEVKKLES
ncbi:oligosaccharide flippase family protein [Clostridium sp. AL.422]|uniref:lipopolysaccharide biosynthesis protein n=1 Tax=Clostridium TaxID=1485 RepID=UPI00293DF299|nr:MULTISPECIES: oligosaccharide flippase family protein [unclassified Clostridium]MDV4150373.1 oligosaccharide flippase family protein [Clostridium sp. AL.422]